MNILNRTLETQRRIILGKGRRQIWWFSVRLDRDPFNLDFLAASGLHSQDVGKKFFLEGLWNQSRIDHRRLASTGTSVQQNATIDHDAADQIPGLGFTSDEYQLIDEAKGL